MAFFTAENVVVSGGGGTSPSQLKVQEWANNVSYTDGQIVTFNGSQYIASGQPSVGLVPPVEFYTPQTPNQPKWLLAARGRSSAKPWDDQATYYADQVVSFLGGTYVLDAPTVAAGTRPNRDKRWLSISEGLTDTEAEKVTSSDITSIAPNVTPSIVAQSDETPRVRFHRFQVAFGSPFGGGTLFQLRFPRSIKSKAPPSITVTPNDSQAAFMLLSVSPVISGNEVTGYSLIAGSGIISGTVSFSVAVKEQIDQVKHT